jgi:hypothetical protein
MREGSLFIWPIRMNNLKEYRTWMFAVNQVLFFFSLFSELCLYATPDDLKQLLRPFIMWHYNLETFFIPTMNKIRIYLSSV